MAKYKNVGFKEFSRYISRLKNGNNPCTMCGASSWRLSTSFEADVGGKNTILSHSIPFSTVDRLSSDNPGELMLNNARPILLRECANCGQTWFFNHDTVLKNLNEESEEEDSSDAQS